MGSELRSTLGPETAAASGRAIPVTSRYIRLGPFQADQHHEEVTKNGVPLKIARKGYQVLLALIEKEGELLTREEIRARLWTADKDLNFEANVNATVKNLRHALGDTSDPPRYIKTILGKGYRLVISGEFVDSPLPPVATNDGWPGTRMNGAKSYVALMKSRLRIPFFAVALILTGMLLGALISKL